MIKISNLTMKYPNGRGISDVDFEVQKGKVVGFLGPNGAGKTTTIRCLLGYMNGQSGSAAIDGLDCFNKADEIAKDIGFIAGEPVYPDGISGIEYLEYIIKIRAGTDAAKKQVMKDKMKELISYFELNPAGAIKKMSKGMKQKIAIVAAFMHSPSTYILDEPTSGLDPLMQNKFVELLLKEKQQGKTVLMSSHMFEEVERTADTIIIIKDGKIVIKDSVQNLKQRQRKFFIVNGKEHIVPILELDAFFKKIAKEQITSFEEKQRSLEQIFLEVYKA